MCGILIADRDSKLLEIAFADLEAIARKPVASDTTQESSLPQVHAMNCLKDVLKNSRLGEASERHVPLAMRLAADALHSPAWAIRNCGLMLFRAVIDRLLGTNEAHSDDDLDGRKLLSVDQHPRLLEVVLGLLDSSTANPDAQDLTGVRGEGVFPALQLFQRLAVPAEQSPAVLKAVDMLMASSSVHVRDKAARTYASLVVDGDASEQLRTMLQTSAASQNALHGALLCAKYLWKKLSARHYDLVARSSSDSSLASVHMSDVVCHMDELYYANTCPVTKAAYIDLLTDLVKDGGDATPADTSPTSISAAIGLRWTLSELNLHANRSGGAAMLRLALVRLLARQIMFATNGPTNVEQRMRQQLLDLSELDADAVAAFFHKLNSFLDCGLEPVAEIRYTIADICEEFSNTADIAMRLQCETLQTLLRLTKDVQRFPPRPLAKTARSTVNGRNQRYMDVHLEWRAAKLERLACSDDFANPDTILEAQDWIACCVAAVKGTATFSCEAASEAIARLDRFYSALTSHGTLEREMVRICITMYDLLNDDDEDVRMLASTAASRVLALERAATSDNNMVPAVANQRLLSFMVRRWPTNRDLIDEAVRRSFGDLEISVVTSLRVAAASDTTLFVEEKQNLYVDDAREAKAWSQALMQLRSTAVSRTTIKQLSHWVAEGLSELIARSGANDQGPLDSAASPELFSLGLQIIYGVQYLLYLSHSGVRLPVRPSALRQQLAGLAYGQGVSARHCLWRREVERVLAITVANLLSAVHATLSRMAD